MIKCSILNDHIDLMETTLLGFWLITIIWGLLNTNTIVDTIEQGTGIIQYLAKISRSVQCWSVLCIVPGGVILKTSRQQNQQQPCDGLTSLPDTLAQRRRKAGAASLTLPRLCADATLSCGIFLTTRAHKGTLF